MQRSSDLLGYRYALQEQIGSGGMGSVYKAHDRLTTTTVAVKRMLVHPHPAALAVSDEHSARLALIHEFEILSRLRHPNIIPMLDYGFDENRQPYLVMPYLGQAQDFIQVSHEAPVSTQVRYLVQLLQALEYLHRHHIIHRDLKPANILIENGRVVVLDFGLAQGSGQEAAEIAGTLLYLAPELLRGEQASLQSDLYAVGVTAYQMFTRDSSDDLSKLPRIVSGEVLLDKPLPDPAAHLKPFIARLLQTQPADRPESAAACIAMLEHLTGESLYTETLTIRDSFLHTARFVGRDKEIKTLTHALEATFLGAGTAWFIAGESGVGKSRVLNELRSLAMVRGALVLNGEALAAGDLPYHLWRGVVRHLLLHTSITDSEAAVLKAIVPDIAQIISHDVAAGTGNLSPMPDQNRLTLAVIDLLKRQTQPTLLLLEDLHWAGESLAILRQLLALHDQLPNLMTVATYRDDELPSLPTDLPGTQVIRLPRLDVGAVTEVAASMLGDAGRRSHVVNFLWQQTEGNAFFIVEIVRALAEESGTLADIGQMTLPHSVVTGSLKQLMQRRLDRLPAHYRPLLDLAAVAGRVLDAHLLLPLAGSLNLEMFLMLGVNAGVLEVADGVWRFAHEKLREHLLQQLSPDRTRDLNRQIAAALEALHPDDPAYDGILCDHWIAGGEPHRALSYALRVIPRDIDFGSFNAALRRAQLLLDKLPEDVPQRTDLTIAAANAHQHLGNFDQAQRDFTIAACTAAERQQTDLQADALRGLGVTHWYQGHHDEARTYLDASLTLHRQIGHTQGIASCLNNLGIVAISADDLNTAQAMLEASLHLYRQAGVDRGIASVLNNLGLISDARQDFTQSRTYYEETLEIFQKLEDQWGIALAYHNLGSTTLDAGDYATAQTYLEQSIEIKTVIGDRHGLALSLLSLAQLHNQRGSISEALSFLHEGLALGQRLGVATIPVAALAGFGAAFTLQQRHDAALVIARFLNTQVIGADTPASSAAQLMMKQLQEHYGERLDDEMAAVPALTMEELMTSWLPATINVSPFV